MADNGAQVALKRPPVDSAVQNGRLLTALDVVTNVVKQAVAPVRDRAPASESCKPGATPAK